MSSPNGPAKRKHDTMSQNSRKSLRADVFYSWPGAEREVTGTQATEETTHLSRDSEKNLQHEASSEDEIQVTGWRHVSVLRPVATKRLLLPSTSEARQETILISSDDDADVRPHRSTFVATLKRKHVGTTSRSSFGFRINSPANADDVGIRNVQPRRKRAKWCKPPEDDTKHNPIMVLDSDEELLPIDPRSEQESDSDSDYDNLHGGYNMGWTISAPDANLSESEDDVNYINTAVATLSLNRIKVNFPLNSRQLSAENGTGGSWAKSFAYKGPPSLRPPARLRPTGPLQISYNGGRPRTGLFKHRPLQMQTPLTRLRQRSGFQMADACQSISQSPGKLLVASTTPGGTMADEENENHEFVIDPYNTCETLAVWTEEQNQIWHLAHYVNSNDPGRVGGPFRRKFYDVKCARFDPQHPNLFTSTGLDGVLTVWSLVAPDEKRSIRRPASSGVDRPLEDHHPHYEPVKRWGKETYGGYCCLDIVYRPQNPSLGNDTTLFAAPCENGTLFIHSYTNTFEQASRFAIRSSRIVENVPHTLGAIVWGCASTSSNLFVCSETKDDAHAFHGAIDIESGKPVYHFDDHRSGEDLAIDADGDTLALFTAEGDDLNLRLYDVRRHNKWARASIELPPASSQLPDDVWPEVRTVAWSPDSILLAVGKNDDVAHVYDVRCLERGPVLSLEHKTQLSHYGITVLSWTTETGLRTPNLGLLTGGGDHCIALWDVKSACERRQVLAELGGKVGAGSFGDFSKGEKPLVAGDTDGHIYIYDFVD